MKAGNNKAERKKYKNIKLAFKIIGIAVIIFIVVFLFFEAVLPDIAFRILGVRYFIIANTGSMEPDLKYCDLVVVEKYDFDKLKAGDVITFFAYNGNENKITITHKITDVMINGQGVRFVQTKGTNAPYPDLMPVSEYGVNGTSVYIGRVKAKSEFFGNLITFLKTPYGIAAVAVNIAGIIAINYILQKTKN